MASGSHRTHAEHRLEQSSTGTQIGNLPQIFHAVTLGLKRIILRAVPQQRNADGLYLGRSGILVGRNHLAAHLNGGADMVGLHCGIVCQRAVINHLRILKAGAVRRSR